MIRTSRVKRRGYSLVELMVALPMATLLMAGLAASIHLAGRSIPNEANLAAATLTASSGLELMASELQYATSISTRTATVLEFTVPDRNGDTAADTIRYGWSGTSGAPLTRQVNGSATEVVAADVNQFGLTYFTRSQIVGGTTSYYLTAVDVALQSRSGAVAVDTSVTFLNEPATSGP